MERLKFTLSPSIKVVIPDLGSLMLNCKAQGSTEITSKRNSKNLSPNPVIFPKGTLFLKKVTTDDAGSYTCIAKKLLKCLEEPMLLFLDVVLYTPGCYSKYVTYTKASTPQLAALTRVSQNCERFIKFECKEVVFVLDSLAWWVSRVGRKMNYWVGTGGSTNTCASGVSDSWLNGQKCNCYNCGSGWREDSGLLTDKSAPAVTQIRLVDVDGSNNEEGYHTLRKLKCYGQA